MSELRQSILRMQASLAPSYARIDELRKLREFFDLELAPLVHASRVVPFGSCASGLWTNTSDVDVTCIVPQCSSKPRVLTRLKVVRDFVSRLRPEFHMLPIVENARIPVLKISTPSALQVDLSINNISGIENSALVRKWTELDPRFVPLAHAVKHWAKSRGINDRATGTLSTYTLLLQLVHVCENLEILPRFSLLKNPKADDDTFFDESNGIERTLPFNPEFQWASPNPDFPLDQVLVEYFRFFSALPEGGEIANSALSPVSTGTLVMRCPLTGKDVNPMTSTVWELLHREFVRARDMMEAANLDQLVL